MGGSRSSPFPFPALGRWYWEGNVDMQVSGETRTWQSQGPLKLVLGNPSFPWVGAASACLLPAPTPFPKPRGLTRAASPRHRPGLHLPNCPSPTDLPPPVTTRHTRAHIVLPLSFEPLRTAPPQLVTNAISWALAMGNERCWHIACIVPTKSSNDFARDSVLS